MYTRLVILLVFMGCIVLFAACSSSDSEGEPAPEMAANLGLARKGLSPSEVDLPCSQPEADAELKVISCRVFRHMGETVHLVGEVENTGETKMAEVSIEAVGYTEDGKTMDTKTDTAYLEPVPPGQRTPFRVFFDARDVAEVQLTVTGDPSDMEPMPNLAISNVTISAPSSGYTHIKGEVNNPDAELVDAIFIAVLRDESDQAVEIHRQKLLKPIPAGTSTFDVLALHHGAQTADVVILPP